MKVAPIVNSYLQASAPLGRDQVPLANGDEVKAFEWSHVKPHMSLRWEPCYGDFDCARLQVPMDWQGHSSERNKTVELALIKLNATVPVTDETYGGAVVFNPGGPGGSGVGQILLGGRYFQTIISAGPNADRKSAKNFDVIGFDPRGVNNTTPTIICQPDALSAYTSALERGTYGWVDTSSTSFDNLWAWSLALGETCSTRYAEEGIAKHVSTAAVARDVVEIFERHGEWREQEALRLLSLESATDITAKERDTIIERTRYRKGDEKIQYWGFSYGTILGATFSAMYPDRVKRVILDGVGDSFDYMSGNWSTSLKDTDKNFARLAEYCFQGGPKSCSLYDPDGPSAITANIQKIMIALQHNPIAVPGNGTRSPTIVTYNNLQSLILDSLYSFLLRAPTVIEVLNELSQGKAELLANLKHESQTSLESEVSRCAARGKTLSECPATYDYRPGNSAIACSDGLPWTDTTKEEYQAYAEQLISQSSLAGAEWAMIMMGCIAWHARPEWRYEGNFTSRTEHPILLIGNTVDPVTPLNSAYKMAKGFSGSGLLHQDSEGHCSMNSVSMCTARAIREYFQSGALPGKKNGLRNHDGYGAFCKPDILPLHGFTKTSDAPPIPEGEEDVALWNTLVTLVRI